MALPQDITFVTVAGNDSPGIAKFTVTPVTDYGFDHKKPRGKGVGFFIPKGEESPPFSISFSLYDEADLEAWTTFAKVLDTSNRSRPLSIEHPTLLDRNISSVVVLSVGAPVQLSDKGPNVAMCRFRKFIAKPPPARTRRFKGDKNKKKTNPIDDDLDRVILERRAQGVSLKKRIDEI